MLLVKKSATTGDDEGESMNYQITPVPGRSSTTSCLHKGISKQGSQSIERGAQQEKLPQFSRSNS